VGTLRFQVLVTPLDKLEVAIADDDRSVLLDASALGVLPGPSGDPSIMLQATLARAFNSC